VFIEGKCIFPSNLLYYSTNLSNYLTNACSNQMPRTKSDKCKVGLEYISKLSSVHVCKSFSGGNTTCTCIGNYEDKLPQVNFFEKEVKEFWKVPSRISVRMDGPAIGKLFGEYLYPFCSFALQRAGYIFPIGGQDMFFVFLP